VQSGVNKNAPKNKYKYKDETETRTQIHAYMHNMAAWKTNML